MKLLSVVTAAALAAVSLSAAAAPGGLGRHFEGVTTHVYDL